MLQTDWPSLAVLSLKKLEPTLSQQGNRIFKLSLFFKNEAADPPTETGITREMNKTMRGAVR